MKHTQSVFATLAVLLTLLALPASAGSSERSFQARFGGLFFDGDSDFWDDSTDVFTLDASDFDDMSFGLTYSHAFNRFFEMDLNADFYDATVVSEYRDYTDAQGFPILHDSTVEMIPITLGMRFLPFGRGKHGKSKPVLFVGAGVGVNFWNYEEFGDFIDFSDPMNPIIFGDLRESGQAFVGYAAAGIEMPLSRNFSVGLEGRYFQSDDRFTGDFAGLGKLDMSGTSASVTGTWRF